MPFTEEPTDDKDVEAACGRWGHPAGKASHERFCDDCQAVLNGDGDGDDGGDPPDDDVDDQDVDQDDLEGETLGQDDDVDEDVLVCPGPEGRECGNKDDGEAPKIYRSNKKLKDFFQNQGAWTPQIDELIEEADAWCSRCYSFIRT